MRFDGIITSVSVQQTNMLQRRASVGGASALSLYLQEKQVLKAGHAQA